MEAGQRRNLEVTRRSHRRSTRRGERGGDLPRYTGASRVIPGRQWCRQPRSGRV